MVNYKRFQVAVRKKLNDGTWESASNQIILSDVIDWQVSKTIGKAKDTISFSISNSRNRMYEQYFSGDGSTTGFTFKFSPIPTEMLSGTTQKFLVYVGGVLQTYTTDYTVSGDTITFVSAPASGLRNIKVMWKVLDTDDLVRIYRTKNTAAAFTNSDIIDEGVIIRTNQNFTPDERNLSIEAQTLMSELFNALVFQRTEAGNQKKPEEIIQDVIAQINEYNRYGQNERVVYGENSTEWSNIGNDTTTNIITYNMNYKSGIELIDDVSSDEKTGNGNYIYFVLYNATGYGSGPTYDFHWKAKPVTSTDTLVEGTDAINTVKFTKDTDEVIKAAIYNCGFDAQSNPMQFLFISETSATGGKWKYITATNTIGEDLISNEFDNNLGVWDFQTLTDGTKVRTSNYPNSYTGPYTMQFEARNSAGQQTGSLATASSDTDFNDNSWVEAQWEGREIAANIVERLNQPYNKAVVTMDYGSDTRTYTLGDVFTLTFPSFGITDLKLRIQRINFSTHETEVHFAEDEKTIATT